MFLGIKSRSWHRGAPAAALAAAGFALGVITAWTVAPPAIRAAAPASGLSAAPPPIERAAAGPYPAEVMRVVDGDTFEARVRLWPGLEMTSRVRLRGIDAPELRARCAAERERAEVARAALARMLARGEVTLREVSLDKYGGRVLAAAAARGVPDIAAALLEAGHVRSYAGRARQGWC
jgi:endonuclease YncB( thermonuclease family)